MIISRLTGGIGNQLFQYALGRRLAIGNGVALKLDLEFYRRYEERDFSLGVFDIRAEKASPAELEALRGKDALWRRAARWMLPKRLAPRHRTVYRERSFEFDPRVLELPAPIYLIGFWQSEKYFSEIEAQLRTELRWVEKPNCETADLLGELRAGDSVALHVRRGDYVSNADVRSRLGFCEPDYYRRAVAALAGLKRLERAFVFTDDPELVRGELDLGMSMHVVSSPRSSAAEDLRLLSACPNKVLSNSSFSWWSVWFGRSPDQVVIAPRRWFASDELSERDLVPAHWMRI